MSSDMDTGETSKRTKSQKITDQFSRLAKSPYNQSKNNPENPDNNNNPVTPSTPPVDRNDSRSSLSIALENGLPEIDPITMNTEAESTINTPTNHQLQGILRVSPTQRAPIQHHTRFQLIIKLDLVRDGEYIAYVRGKLLSILRDIQSSDPNVVLQPWLIEHRDAFDPIRDFSVTSNRSLPTSLSDLSKYIYGFRIPREGQRKEVWTKICLTHSRTCDDIIDNAQEKLQKERWNLMVCRLQVEEVTVIGWLLYSCRHFQDDKLLTTIFSALFKHEVSLFWRKITGYNANQDNQSYQHAIHVEVESNYSKSATAFFSKLYGPRSSKKTWPLGIKMSLIPEMNKMAPSKVERALFLCARQGLFTKDIQTATLHSLIGSLDTVLFTEPYEVTLRNAFLDTTLPGTTNDPGTPSLVFHAITVNRKNEPIATFFKYAQSYARMVVASPLTFIKHFYNTDIVDRCFSEEEREKSQSEVMDKKTKEIDTLETTMMSYAYDDDGYAGHCKGDVMLYAHLARQKSQIDQSTKEIPIHLQSYNRQSGDDDFRSVDLFTVTGSQSSSVNSRTLRQVHALSSQAINHFNQVSSHFNNSVPTPAATGFNPSVRFSDEGRTGGQGR